MAVAGWCVNPSPAFSARVASEARPISGTVTDETGAPLPGASVLVKGTTRGTTTDIEGKFVLEVGEGPDVTLEISYVGYYPQEVSVTGQSPLVIRLDSDVSQLSEVVVVGYGTQKRSDVTGSIASVSSENFNRGVVTNPES